MKALSFFPASDAGAFIAHQVLDQALQQVQMDHLGARAVFAPARFADLVPLGQIPDREVLGHSPHEER
ncbi:hypothetical protein ACIA6D_41810 [Streptomyces cacaoi]